MKENQKQPQKKQLKMLEKQRLGDMEHKINTDVSSFLLLLEEGSAAEVDTARKKARGDLLKWGQEMQHIAQTLGGKYPNTISEYLNSVDTLLHCPTEFVDPEKVNQCYSQSRNLEEML